MPDLDEYGNLISAPNSTPTYNSLRLLSGTILVPGGSITLSPSTNSLDFDTIKTKNLVFTDPEGNNYITESGGTRIHVLSSTGDSDVLLSYNRLIDALMARIPGYQEGAVLTAVTVDGQPSVAWVG